MSFVATGEVFLRIIRQYALDRHVISRAFAIRAMTSLPASVAGLTDRGTLRVGNWQTSRSSIR